MTALSTPEARKRYQKYSYINELAAWKPNEVKPRALIAHQFPGKFLATASRAPLMPAGSHRQGPEICRRVLFGFVNMRGTASSHAWQIAVWKSPLPEPAMSLQNHLPDQGCGRQPVYRTRSLHALRIASNLNPPRGRYTDHTNWPGVMVLPLWRPQPRFRGHARRFRH